MSGLPAARFTDKIFCILPQILPALPPPPHTLPLGLPIISPCAPTVLIGGLPAARISDFIVCITPIPLPNPIIKGAFPVPIFNMPAARMLDSASHLGSLIMPPCCPSVLIGLSGVAGNVMAGTAMCQAASSGRTSGTTSQSYNNCGVESSRQIINQINKTNVTENGLLQSAINSGNAAGTPGSPIVFADGGTGSAGRQSILNSAGIASTVATTSPQNLGVAMSQSSGVIVNLDAAVLWGAPTPPGSLHAITVTGVEYDDAGNRTAVIINDTGTGQCGQRVNPTLFDQATAAHPNSQLNITTNPAW